MDEFLDDLIIRETRSPTVDLNGGSLDEPFDNIVVPPRSAALILALSPGLP